MLNVVFLGYAAEDHILGNLQRTAELDRYSKTAGPAYKAG